MNARAQAMLGIDTHKHSFSAGIVAGDGTDMTVASFPNTLAGCEELQSWLDTELGIEIVRVGIEGSGGWGRHVAVWLVGQGHDVREVPSNRTAQRRNRRRRPKTDREDALAIARETLADPQLGPARAAMDVPEPVAELQAVMAHRGALARRRRQLLGQTEGVLAALDHSLRAHLPRTRSAEKRLRAICELDLDTFLPISKATAERLVWLDENLDELASIDARLAEIAKRLPQLLRACGCTLTNISGIGPIGAAQLVADVGDPSRFRSESAFARWCGVAPVACSSGEGHRQPERHRLDLFGNRTINGVLYTASLSQCRHIGPGRDYFERKIKAGMSAKEARRAHKRQLANVIIRHMWKDTQTQRCPTIAA